MDPYYYSGGPGAAAGGGFGADYQYHPDHFTTSAAAAAAAGAGAGATTMLGSPASDKARMGELAFLKTTLQGDSFFLPSDWEESVLGLILSGLRHGNSQVCLAALDCLLALVPQLRLYELTPHAKEACAALAELLGDSRPSVRERTQGALQLVAHKVGGGVTAVLEALAPAVRNARSSTRMRQEAARCLGGLASSLMGIGTEGTPELEPEDRRLLIESLATLATDQHPDVQAAGEAGVAKLLSGQQVDVEAVVQELGAVVGDEGRWRALALGYQLEEGSVVEVQGPVGSLASTLLAGAAAAAAMNVGAAVRQQRGGPPTTLGPSKEKEAVVTGAVEGVVEVVALPLHSEREVAEAMDAVAGGLLASEEQWQARVEALQRLQSIAVGGAGQAQFEALFIPAVKSLQEAITAQVCSLRSALSREGMATVAVLAQALGESFAPLADCWVPALLRMAQSNTLLTALSADQCLRCVVACTRQGFPRLLQPLLEGGSGSLKNDVARMRCVNAVTLALWRWEEAAFERGGVGVDGVVRMIEAAVADKKEPVRAAARQCFWAFHRKFPSAAAHLLEHGLDAPRARMLRKEQSLHTSPAALEALVPARRYKVVAAAQQQPQQQQRPAHPSSSSKKPAAGHPPSVPAAAAEAPHHQHHHALGSGAMRAAAAPHAPAPAASNTTTSGARRQSLGPLGLAPGSGPLRVAAAAPPSAAGPPEGGSSGSSNKLPPAAAASHRGGSAAAQRVMSQREKPPTALLPRGGGGNSGGESSSSSGGSGGGSEPTTGSKPMHGGGGGGGRLSMSGPLRVVRQPPGGTTAHTASVPSSSSGSSNKDPIPSSEAKPPVTVEPAAEPEQSPRVYPRNAAGWDGLLRAAESGHWAERLRCLEDVCARLRDFNAVALADAEGDAAALEEQHAAGLARVVAALARHLYDGNARVAHAAMDGIGEALRLPTAGLGAAAVGPYLEQLLPRVLVRAVDPKEQVRATAMGALDGCTARVEPSALCAALAKALHDLAQGDKANVKALVLALDTLRATVPRAGPAFFSTAAPTTRALLSRLAALLGGGRRAAPSASVERATVGCLQALQTTLDGAAFAHALSALAAEPQLAVRRALAAAGTPVPPAAAPHHPHPHPVAACPSAAEEAAAPRPRPRSQSIGRGGAVQGPPPPPVAPVATAAPPRGVLPPKEPSRTMTPAVGAVGDENSAPPGVYHPPSSAASSASNSSGTKPKAQQARTPSSASTPPSGHTSSLAPEVAAARALAILSDATAAVEFRSQALEALASALARGAAALWERHCGAALHLFLDGVKRWQQEQQEVGGLPCALLQPVPTVAQGEEEETWLLDGGGNGANVWASAVKLPSATTKQHSQQHPPRDRAAVASLHLSLRGLRYLVRLARRQAQQQPGAGFAFDAYLEVTAGRLLGCAATPDYAVFQSAERTLSLLLLAGVHPARSFAFLVAAATAPGTPTPRLLMALRALSKLLPRVPPATATAALPSLCPLLVRAVADPEIVLRMTSVACIAALYLVVEDALLPHLHAKLRPVHLKLVTIYIKRATAAAAHVQVQQQQQQQQQRQQQGQGEDGEEEGGEGTMMRARAVVSPPQRQQAVALRPALCEIASNGR